MKWIPPLDPQVRQTQCCLLPGLQNQVWIVTRHYSQTTSPWTTSEE